MKAFVSSLAALFLAAGVIGCGDTNTGEPVAEDPATTAEHEALMSGDMAGDTGHAAEGEAAPAEGEGDAAAPAEGEGDAAAPAEGDAAAPAEGEGDAAAPAEGEAKTE